MKKLNLMIGLLLIVSSAWAQTQRAYYDINRALLTWQPGSGGGPVKAFTIKCGQSSGSYTMGLTVNDPALRQMALKDVVSGNGDFYCVISASNEYGESPNSAEIFFAAGAAPSTPTAFGVSR